MINIGIFNASSKLESEILSYKQDTEFKIACLEYSRRQGSYELRGIFSHANKSMLKVYGHQVSSFVIPFIDIPYKYITYLLFRGAN